MEIIMPRVKCTMLEPFTNSLYYLICVNHSHTRCSFGT